MSAHLSSRQIILAGFAGVAVFTLVMLGLGLTRLAEVNAQMDELANRTFRCAEAVYTMRMVARDRLASLQGMFFLRDHFERDEERLRYSRMALTFIQAGETLLGLAPGRDQRQAWEQARALIAEDEKLHEQALDAMMAERPQEAAYLIRRHIRPLEARLTDTLDGMLEIERAKTQRLLADANRRYLPWGEHLLRVGMSAGVVAIDPTLTASELVHRADRACYQAKARRRVAGMATP
ncbi:hypothetical protein [Thiobacter aerophilum]|uniref:Uncharacterized protein n=1 Tax=Thiobacter aerophilum TaxID=3121275 RepID=A0ABV0EGR5_9BURK